MCSAVACRQRLRADRRKTRCSRPRHSLLFLLHESTDRDRSRLCGGTCSAGPNNSADAAAHKAVDLLWFVHGLSFNFIGSPLFCDAVAKIKAAPCYKPCHRTTLSTSHLAARNADADEFKIKRLQHGKQYGFLSHVRRMAQQKASFVPQLHLSGAKAMFQRKQAGTQAYP